MSADSRVRRTGDETTASIRSAAGASQPPVARIWSRPSSLRPGLSPPRPPLNFLAAVCGVTPCRTRISVVPDAFGRPQPLTGVGSGPGAGSWISSISDGSSSGGGTGDQR